MLRAYTGIFKIKPFLWVVTFWSHTSSVSATEKGHYGEVSAELAFLIGLGDVTACSPGMLLIEFQLCFYAYKDFSLFVCLF